MFRYYLSSLTARRYNLSFLKRHLKIRKPHFRIVTTLNCASFALGRRMAPTTRHCGNG
ncbi:unnamed protein product [Ixodes pacificus]